MSKIDDVLEQQVYPCYELQYHDEAKEHIKYIKQALYKDMVEVIDEAIDKTKKDKHKTSLAHELYSGSVDAHSYRIGWDFGLENLRQELRTKLREYFGVKE